MIVPAHNIKPVSEKPPISDLEVHQPLVRVRGATRYKVCPEDVQDHEMITAVYGHHEEEVVGSDASSPNSAIIIIIVTVFASWWSVVEEVQNLCRDFVRAQSAV